MLIVVSSNQYWHVFLLARAEPIHLFHCALSQCFVGLARIGQKDILARVHCLQPTRSNGHLESTIQQKSVTNKD